MVVLMCFWLQAAKADFYNPLSQFVVRAISFAVNPLRKIIPGFGGLDLASLLLAFIVAVGKITALIFLVGATWEVGFVLFNALVTVIKEGLNVTILGVGYSRIIKLGKRRQQPN